MEAGGSWRGPVRPVAQNDRREVREMGNITAVEGKGSGKFSIPTHLLDSSS